MSNLRRYNVNEIYANRFYQMPKFLFDGEFKTKLSSDAKILYALLKDRFELSVKNSWIDENGDVFMYFTRQEMCELLCCGKNKAIKLCNELKDFGLIEEVRQGLNKPNKIYLTVVEYELTQNNDDNKKDDKKEIEQAVAVKDDIIDLTELIEEEQAPAQDMNVDDEIKDNIEYDFVKENRTEIFDFVDTCYELMREVMHSSAEKIRIAKVDKNLSDVKERFKKITLEHIEYIKDSIDNSKTEIKNIKQYLLASLYNAPATIDTYYENKVNHDLQKE